MLKSRSLLSSLSLLLAAGSTYAQDFVVPAGTQTLYDTSAGPLRVDSLIIEPGAALFARGPVELRVFARQSIVIDGLLDVSGGDSTGVLTLNTTNVPELGATGGPGAGAGGVASRFTSMSTPDGHAGVGTGTQLRGGLGGETSYHPTSEDARRGAGGGGGALGPDQPVSNDLNAEENVGLFAAPGFGGGPDGLGAIRMTGPATGGRAGGTPFRDGDPANDFFGVRVGPGGALVVGELPAPLAGRGGGAGGDAVTSATFPRIPFLISGDEKGSGGGGGGGLAILVAPRVSVGALGAVRADGGSGGGGENTFFFNRVGGGSGGGSGGFVLIQARRIDLSAAGLDAFSARGGRGGPGKDNVFGGVGSGGNGGPGLVQFHVPGGAADILLPTGTLLEEMGAPDPIVLLPQADL